MKELAFAIKEWFIYPEASIPQGGMASIDLGNGKSKQKSFGLNGDDIIIEEVDLTDPNIQTRKRLFPTQKDSIQNSQGPSSAAIQVTRLVDVSDKGPDDFRTLLANTVIDIFVDYEVVKQQTVSRTDGKSQSGQTANSQIDIARSGRSSGGATTGDENLNFETVSDGGDADTDEDLKFETVEVT